MQYFLNSIRLDRLPMAGPGVVPVNTVVVDCVVLVVDDVVEVIVVDSVVVVVELVVEVVVAIPKEV